MPLAATKAPYTLFIVDDDMPLNPVRTMTAWGKWSVGMEDTGWGISTIFQNPVIFCKNCSFQSIPAAMTGTIRYLRS